MSRPRDKHFAYGSQLYGSGLFILLLPAYFTRLGAEQFALMMMFFVAQGWIQIADFGFPLALSREIAATNREHQPSKIGSMLTALQLPMLPGMALVGVAVVGFCEWIARRGSEGVFDDAGTASLAIVFAALSLSLRWGSELYRAALAGAEQFVGLAALNIFSATARLGGALAILIYTGEDLFAWLICQAALSVVEMLVLVLLCRQKLGLRLRGNHGESTTVLRALRPMALQIAVASATWISITQLDKLILSQTLSLREYGAIGIASAIPVGLLTLAIPLLQLSYPALVRLHVAESRREQTALYLSLTAATCCLLFPTALVCVTFSEELLTIWFAGRLNAAEINAASLIPLYAAGASFLALSSMPYGLLNARGELQRHVAASLSLAVCTAVALVIGSLHSGAKGAIALWCGSFGLFFLIWPQVVHSRYLEGGWWPWMRTITLFALSLGFAAYSLKHLLSNLLQLAFRFGELAIVWIVLQGLAFCMLWLFHRSSASGQKPEIPS
jgi:O-antigen/teichoic acid export membrane protein